MKNRDEVHVWGDTANFSLCGKSLVVVILQPLMNDSFPLRAVVARMLAATGILATNNATPIHLNVNTGSRDACWHDHICSITSASIPDPFFYIQLQPKESLH